MTGVWVGVLFTFMGSLFAVFAVAIIISMRRFSARALRATGQVVDLQRVRSSDAYTPGSSAGPTYRPVVNFFDRDGLPREFTSSVGFSPPRHRPGDTVAVLYDPDLPNQASIEGAARAALPVGIGGMGSLFVAVGVLILVLVLN